MLRCRDGDDEAFRKLFARYRTKIINFCFRFCSDRSIAEDLGQEVFLKMYRAAPRYRPDARFRTWLFTIATNVCLNDARRKRGQAGMLSLDAPINTPEGTAMPEIDDPTADSADRFIDHEREAVLQSALGKLPDKQRAALLLRIHHEFSYGEIAAQLGCSESAVKTYIHRGRQTLSEILTPYFKGGT